ncbi:hypothetical protein [Mariniradius saccharolyticus]|nr:hypothetical protein [Mariniradius saccharolyticus]
MESFYGSSGQQRYKVWDEESTLKPADFLLQAPLLQGKASARISYQFKVSEDPSVRVDVVVDRFKSFIHKEHISEYLIRHEEYHLKLAHSFAKEINQSIEEKNLTFSQALDFVQDRIQRDRQFQKMYDKETNHSLIRPKQGYWEYKIDSMLNKSIDYQLFQDTQNIEVYFPDKPRNLVVSIDDERFNGYLLEKYGVKFSIVDLKFISEDKAAHESDFIEILFAEERSKIIVNRDLSHPNAIFESYSQDTVEKKVILDKLLLGKNTTYWLRHEYPIVGEHEETYKRMADQFFISFKVIDE